MPERYGVSAKGLLQTSGASPGWQIRSGAIWGRCSAQSHVIGIPDLPPDSSRLRFSTIRRRNTYAISSHFLGHLLVLLNRKGSFVFVYDLGGIASWASREYRTTILSAWHAFLMPKQEPSGCAHELNPYILMR